MTKSNIFEVSQSKVSCYRKCKQAYWYRYVERLRRKFKARPLQFGSLVHSMLEADANNKNPYKVLKKETEGQKLFAAEREELEEIASDVRIIMRDYFVFWEASPKKDQLIFDVRKGKAAEHEEHLELTKGISLVVKLDGLATTGDGRKMLVEHKTFKQMPSDDHRWRNLQASIYKWAIDKLKIKVDGMVWDYIRSKTPSTPQILKDGTISKKRLDTLPEALRQFEKDQKMKVPERILKTAIDNQKNYFIRNFTAFRSKTVEAVHADFVETAIEMKETHGTKKAKTIDRHCDWCEYEPLCRAELTGSDINFIKKKEYTTSEQREKERELASAD